MKTVALMGLVLAAAMAVMSAVAEVPFRCVTNADNTVTIAGYQSTNTEVTVVAVPDRIGGLPVTSIGANAFLLCRHRVCSNLTSVTIPEGVTNIGTMAFGYCYRLTNFTIPSRVVHIGDWAFSACHRLTSVCFKGDAPNLGTNVFHGATNVTVYYLEGTKGWGPTFGGRPTAVWKPEGGVATNSVPVVGTQR